MIDTAWQNERLAAHERFIETAKRRVTEAEERLHLLRCESQDRSACTALIEITENLLKTNQNILQEMQTHGEYMREQFDYLNSLEERHPENA
jgi:K+/H+ antiporter YhaU regulatory subunit KhtT